MTRFPNPAFIASAAVLLVATYGSAHAQTYSVLYNLGTNAGDPESDAGGIRIVAGYHVHGWTTSSINDGIGRPVSK